MAERDEDVANYGVLEGSAKARAERKRDRKRSLQANRDAKTPEQFAEEMNWDLDGATMKLKEIQSRNRTQEAYNIGTGAEKPDVRQNSGTDEIAAANSPEPNTPAENTQEVEQQQADDSNNEETPLTLEERLDLVEQENVAIRERAALEKKESDLDRDSWRDRYNREVGKKDFQRKSDRAQNDGTADDISSLLTELDYETAGGDEVEPERRERAPKYDPNKIARAKVKALAEFTDKHSDITVVADGNTDLKPHVVKFIQERADDFAEETAGINPQSAYKQMWRLMDQARTSYLLDERTQKDEEIANKRAAIRSGNRNRKMRAQLSDSSSGRSVNPNAGQDPALEGMSRKDRLREKLRNDPNRPKCPRS